MIAPGWASFILCLVIAICGVVSSWAVVRYQIKQTADKVSTTDETMKASIASLESAIRDVGKEIKGLLFNTADAGRPFYRRVDDCEEVYKNLDGRVKTLEQKAHAHPKEVPLL